MTSFVLAASPWKTGSWKELARIDWMRGTAEDDKMNVWWEHLFDTVPAFTQLCTEASSTNSKGNVVEACVGASFLASHEHARKRYHFRTVPPDALEAAAQNFPRFAACGVSTPPLAHRGDYPDIPAVLEGAVPHSSHLRGAAQPASFSLVNSIFGG